MEMDKHLFVYMLIEAIVFLLPIGALFIKVGKLIGRIEVMEKNTTGLPEWRATTDTKVTQLELQTIAQQHVLDEINKNIVSIATKMDLLLDDRIKMGMGDKS